MFHFGNLELKRLGKINTSDLIFREIRIKGFWLVNWMRDATAEIKEKWKNYVINSFKQGEDTFYTKYSKEFPLGKIEEALMYYMQNMSGGKVILKP